MADKPFSLESRMKKGYDVEQVNDFFDQARKAFESDSASPHFPASKIRYASFDMMRGGYNTREVDTALDRLENAFLKRERANAVAEYGQDQWNRQLAEKATTLYPRMLRPEGERFAHPKGKGYKADEVDELVDALAAFFDDGEELSSRDIRKATFRVARGQKAYEEGVVDAYLSRATEILLAVEQ